MSNILNFRSKITIASVELNAVMNAILQNDRYLFWVERKKLLGHPYADAIIDALDLIQKEIIALSTILTLNDLPVECECGSVIDHVEMYPNVYIFLVIGDATVVFQCFNIEGELTHENYVAQKTKNAGQEVAFPSDGWKGLILKSFNYLAKLHQGGFELLEKDGAHRYEVVEPRDGYVSFMSVTIRDSLEPEDVERPVT